MSSTPTPQSELEIYEATLRKGIDAGYTEIFSNSSPEHAAIIFKVFCETAKDTIRIYCGKLSKMVYGTLGEQIKAAADRGVNIQVLTAATAPESAETAAVLQSLNAIRHVDENAAAKLPHFAVIDSKRYRIETDANQRRAFVCANASDTSSQSLIGDMEDAFAYLWGNSTEIV